MNYCIAWFCLLLDTLSVSRNILDYGDHLHWNMENSLAGRSVNRRKVPRRETPPVIIKIVWKMLRSNHVYRPCGECSMEAAAFISQNLRDLVMYHIRVGIFPTRQSPYTGSIFFAKRKSDAQFSFTYIFVTEGGTFFDLFDVENLLLHQYFVCDEYPRRVPHMLLTSRREKLFC